MPEFHKPVLVRELLTLLEPKAGGVYVDATLGGGGHAAAILECIGPEGVLIGIDRDADAIEYARERLKHYRARVVVVQGNFRDLHSILQAEHVAQIDGAVFDLGVSSHQLDSARGFSFSRDEKLDMRMGQQEDVPTAERVVNDYTEQQLADLIWRYGEERYARRVARAIVRRRQEKPIETTRELADIVASAIPGGRRGGIHPATRTFQAVRIEVNAELDAVEKGVTAAVEALKTDGRVCVVSFHSLEDRIVKSIFRRLSGHCECPPRLPECRCGARKMLDILTPKPVVPGAEEIKENPRARSAKLRCAMRVE